MPNGVRLEFDNVEMARLWHPGWRTPQSDYPSGRAIINFSLASRADVDRCHAELTAAGHLGHQVPYDAFWGGRYAIVADPDGNECGLMGPTDATHKYTPTSHT
jgi:catechol 2,3-dioxygenase-like lactoylglutathione lyase family enzyme